MKLFDSWEKKKKILEIFNKTVEENFKFCYVLKKKKIKYKDIFDKNSNWNFVILFLTYLMKFNYSIV